MHLDSAIDKQGRAHSPGIGWFHQTELRLTRVFWALSCLVLLLHEAALGSEASASFDQANKLYEQGNYAEAIQGYQKLIQDKQISAALYFNLGNAYFKSGKVGQAIASYRLAEQLDPRDPDIRANLRFARDSVGSKAPDNLRWQRWLSLLKINEVTVIAVTAFWLWLMLVVVGELRRDWQAALVSYKILAGMVTLLAMVWLGLVLRQRLGISSAVIIARDAVVHYGPFDESSGFYTLHDGAELTVLDRKDKWLQVVDGSKRVGWVPQKDVMLIPRG